MTALSDLFTQISKSTVVTNVKAIVSTLGLFPDDWEEGDPEEAIVEGVAQTFAQMWNTYVWLAILGGFLDYATGGWLTLLARNVFFVERITATFSAGAYVGTNATASPIGPYNPGDLVFVNTDTGKTYRNTGTVTFAPSTTTTVQIEATELGTVSDGAPTKVVLQTTVIGVSGSNPAPVAGRDDETDEQLRVRCRLKPASLSPNGPAAAYEYVCLTPDFHGVTVTQVKVSPHSATGTVDILIAGPSGAISDPADVTKVDDAVHANVTPDSVTSTVTSAVAHSIPITWQAWVHADANVDPVAAASAVDAAFTAAFKTFRIGGDEKVAGSGFVFLEKLKAIIDGAIPQAFDVAITSPAADVAIVANEVPTYGGQTSTSTVTVV